MARPPKQSTAQPTLIDVPVTVSETPLMKQYYAMKAQYPGALMLFRVGDFYETFGEDAVVVSQILGIVLTKRANGAASHVELAGFPYHSLDTYLPKLVRAGKRVAVCDQLEDPASAKGLVKRGVTEIASPGVTLNDRVLESNRSNYLAAVYFADAQRTGIAFLELSTGDFFCAEGDKLYTEKLLGTLQPSEVLICRGQQRSFEAEFPLNLYLTRQEDWIFQYDYAREKLLELFRSTTLKGFGIEEMTFGTVAAGAIAHYLNENHQRDLGHITKIYRFDDSEFVWLDRFTIRNLELVQPLHPDSVPLVDVLDKTHTAMGARLMRRALLLPLKNVAEIRRRLAIVAAFVQADVQPIVDILRQMGDLERLVSKTATLRLRPREAALLRDSLALIAPFCEALQQLKTDSTGAMNGLAQGFANIQAPLAQLQRYLRPDVGASVQEGEVIAEGISAELDEYREIKANGKQHLLRMQQREMERTGITSLKFSYNKVFGYYIEVTNVHQHKVPKEWIRKQTLTNAERYITEELKGYEDKILAAEDKIFALEQQLYAEMLQSLLPHLQPIQQNAAHIAEADMLLSFAQVARQRNYVMPTISEGEALQIRGGRHPVIETTLPADKPYIPNDTHLRARTDAAADVPQIIILTGPNMGGKSSLLRQTALITLMAQVGCFVPAESAEIGIVDKIFTRVGASDNIAGGESTFMVEMNETAQIANNATRRSLILLDEIGRGTSTYDGVSIAWALAEFLHERIGAKTLFATHYHELNELEAQFPHIQNFHVSVKETDGRILFLRKVLRGGTEHSFGIHVAEMAGMPAELVRRATQLLAHFEANRMDDKSVAQAIATAENTTVNMSVFELQDEMLLRLRALLADTDINRLTPVEALLKLQELKVIAGN